MKYSLLLSLGLFLSTLHSFGQGNTCANPYQITSLPFSQTGMTTCGFGDNYNQNDACGNNYMRGNDFVFEFTPTTQQHASISLDNTNSYTGLFILDGCPDNNGTQCLASDISSNGDPEIGAFTFIAGQTYYIVISTYPGFFFGPQCTPFDIDIKPPLAPTVQDCEGAIPICQDVYTTTNSYSGAGNILNEIHGSSCLSSGEKNDVWYTFTVQQGGLLEFIIDPNSNGNDYDWAVYNLTNHGCSDINSNSSLEVSCNFSSTSGNTGPNQSLNWSSSNNQGAGGDPFNYVIPVQTGETYVINVSNFSSSQSGYEIDFSESTADIYDVTPPEITSISPVSCGTNTLNFSFSEAIQCATIADPDFELQGPGGPYTLTAVNGNNCISGGNQEDAFFIQVSPPITVAGNYQFCLTNNDGSVTDLCGNVAPAACVGFTLSNTVIANAGQDKNLCLDPNGNPTSTTIGSLNAGGGGSTPYTYSWTPTTGLSNATIANPSASPSSTTTYTLTVTDANGCSAQDNVTLTVAPLTPPTTHVIDESCPGANDGSVSISATGVAPYSYTWNTNPVQTSPIAANLAAGNYSVTVTDANGCGTVTSVTVNGGTAIQAGFQPLSPQCITGNSFSFANVGSNNQSYSWDFGDGNSSTQENPTHTYSSAGSFTVSQTVGSGNCAQTATNTLVVYDIPTLTLSATNTTCASVNNGEVSVTSITNSNGPYSYSWSNGDNGTTSSNLSPGTYTVTVTDLSSGCQVTATETVNMPNALQVSLSENNPTCPFSNTGSINSSVNGGTPPYIYSWNTIPIQTTANISNINAGTYSCTVTDANGCTITDQVTLTDPSPLQLSSTNTIANCGQADGSANITVTSGGSGNYSYSWNTIPVQTTPSANNLAGGNYIVTVTDQTSGCTQNDTVTVSTTSSITVSASLVKDVSCFGAADGEAIVTASGGASPYTYSWNTTPAQNSSTATSTAGTYTATVTDANGCTGSSPVSINEPMPINTTISNTTDVMCLGDSTGSATVQVTGGTPNYTYSWNTTPVQTSTTAQQLPSGNYTVTITDDNNCTETSNITIAAGSQISSSTTSTAATCQSGGSIDLQVSNGAAPYDFLWSNGATTEDLNSLGAGSYSVIITDQNGCTHQESVSITSPPSSLTISLDSLKDVSCNGYNDGYAKISVSNGVAPYTYSWNTTPTQTTDELQNVGFGSYTVTVNDANNCSSYLNITINQGPALGVSTGTSPASCGINTGTAWAVPNNGTPPYTYNWDSSGTTLGTLDTLKNIYAGNYTLTVTDSKGCKFTDFLSVGSSAGGQVTITSLTTPTCYNGADGTATASINGGSGPFTYAWNTNPVQTTSQAINLPSGTITVSVTDASGCVFSASDFINNPAQMVISTTVVDKFCANSCNGEATAVAVGGTAPYTYQWDNNQLLQTATNLCPNTYTVTITDAKNCTETGTAIISAPLPIVTNVTTQQANCNQANGNASVSVMANGTAPFTYIWANATDTLATTTNLNNVIAGTYYAITTDDIGCQSFDTVTIANQSGPTIVLDSLSDVSCNGDNNGFIQVSITGGTFPFTYSWDDPAQQSTPIATNLPAGGYIITVTDNDNCVASTSFGIAEPDILQLQTISQNPTCYNGSNGTANVIVQGGSTPYTYQWNTTPSQQTAQANDLTAGTYTVLIVDGNGCSVSADVTLNNPTNLSATLSSNDVTCYSACDGDATVTASNGTTPYTYLWNDPNQQSTTTASNICAGPVTVTITDANGCTTQATTTISEPLDLVNIVDTIRHSTCNGANDGFVSITPQGGTGPFTYNWTPGNHSSSNLNNVNPGSYTITTTDQNGCTVSDIIVINEPNPMSSSFFSSDVTCYEGNDGIIDLSVVGGTNPYQFQWDDPSLQQTEDASSLPVGNYTVLITDANGCTLSNGPISIIQPQELSSQIAIINSTCGYANGSAQATPIGGMPPYQFHWNSLPINTSNTLSNTVAGSYQFTLTDANGCISSEPVNINDIDGPTVTIASSTDVTCYGDEDGSATALVVGGTTPYTSSWNSPGSPSSVIAGNLNGGTYTYTVIDANSCIASASATIIENPPLAAQVLTTNDVLCAGDNTGSATVIMGGGNGNNTINWDSNPIQNTAIADQLPAGTYIVTVTDQNNCSAKDTTIITEPAPLNLTLDSLRHISCDNAQDGYIKVSVTGGHGGYFYQWTPSISNSPIAAGLDSNNYSLVLLDNNGCSITDNYTINEPDALSFTIINNSTTCSQNNGSASIENLSGGTNPYTYSWNDPNSQTSPQATNLTSGSYSASVVDANGCTQTVPTFVNDLAGPTIDSLIVKDVDCNGGADGTATVYINGNGPFTYLWDDAFGQTFPTATGLSASPPLYTVTVTDVNNCIITATAQVNEPAPLHAFIAFPDTVCYKEPIQLFANAAGGTPPYNFNWPSNNGFLGQGPLFDTLSNSFTYTVNVMDGSPSGCTASVQEIVVVRPPLNSSATDATICRGDTASLLAACTGGLNQYAFSWYVYDPVSGSTSSTGVINPVNPLNVTPIDSTRYMVIASDGCSPDDTTITDVFVNEIPSLQLVSLNRTGCVSHTADFTLISDNGTSFQWDFDNDGLLDQFTDSNFTTHTYTEPGSYSVSITALNATGCSASITKINWVQVYDNPTAIFGINPNPGDLVNAHITFEDMSINPDTWSWNFGDGTTDTIQNPVHLYEDTGSYNVTLLVTNPIGCKDSITKLVYIDPASSLFIANAFTPDDDGINDTFFPVGVGIDNNNYDFFIFNRWGEIIFESHAFNEGWDGRNKRTGEVCQTGVYTWLLKAKNFSKKKINKSGRVTLLK